MYSEVSDKEGKKLDKISREVFETIKQDINKMKETEISNINDIELFKQKIKFLEENNASLEKELQENKMKYRKIANEIIEIKEEVNMHSYW